jgi:small subunit ribosomal protein S4
MGDPKKSRRRWQGPRHPWKKENLGKELALVGKFGLRNKRELWYSNAVLKSYRKQAGSILALEEEERAIKEKDLISKLSGLGLLEEGAVLDSVLGLSVEDILQRRLQTILLKLNKARTPYQARQLIVHGHVRIGNRRISSPGYLVSRNEEPNINCALELVAAEAPEAGTKKEAS